MNKEEAMKIAQEYAKEHHPDCNIIWYAGEKSGWHFIWMKNTSLPRYTGLGIAIKISSEGKIVNINSTLELMQITSTAYQLND